MSSKTVLEGAGSGVLLTLSFTRNLLPRSYSVFSHPFPVSSVFLGLLTDVIAISIVASLAWTIADRFDRRSLFWLFVPAGVISIELYEFLMLREVPFSHFTLVGWFVAVVMLGVGLRVFHQEWFMVLVRVVRGSLVLLGFSAIWMIPELLYTAARSSAHEMPEFSAKTHISRYVTGPRVVWLVFDELSYDQTYEHRWPGLKLPNFDRLLSESVTFSDVRPAGLNTPEVIPSLFLGRIVSEAKISSSGEFSVRLPDESQWRHLDASQTIFADVRRLGWTSGIVGWYFPYCRIMVGWVDSCSWSNHMPLRGNLNPEQGILLNAAAPYLDLVDRLVPGAGLDRYDFLSNLAKNHQRDYQSVMERAVVLLHDSSIRFAYVHLNVPHPPGIYDRKAHAFSRCGSYIDNLALADQALGQLLDTLENTPAWSDTTLIVCGDHSWRMPLWRQGKVWTQEDEIVSMGRFDARPVLSIHFPGQRVGSRMSRGFPALAVHEVIEKLIRGQLRSADDLVRWTSESASLH